MMFRLFVLVLSTLICTSSVRAAELDVALGKALFDRAWVPAPASTDASDGLGPLFNAKSGGAVFTPVDGQEKVRGLVVRLVEPSLFGRQLQDQAVPGLKAEAKVAWNVNAPVVLFDETPKVALQTEPRFAPSLRLSAAIENVDPSAIASLADPDDKNADGISGRLPIGRFGLKANHPTLEDQVADAFAFDMGLSSQRVPLPWGDCNSEQTECRSAPHGVSKAMGGHELSEDVIRLVSRYVRSLKPKPVSVDTAAETVFVQTGCANCHQPTLAKKTAEKTRIFSDLLLHDLGPENAGVIGDENASASEWRTAPLVDLFPEGQKRRYMHSGKAGTLTEAIALHGGEASAARQNFAQLTESERDVLLRYLKGL
jgi:CxxC motif-containing protein (DUF1111 family)